MSGLYQKLIERIRSEMSDLEQVFSVEKKKGL